MVPESGFSEKSFLQRQENIARRTYKLREWLKLISYHEVENLSHEIDDIITKEVHQNFVVLESFWVYHIKRKFDQPIFNQDSVRFCLLALEDGPYFEAAEFIVEKCMHECKNKRFSYDFCVEIIEEVIKVFEYDSKMGPHFYAKLRAVCMFNNDIAKTREVYERQLMKGYDDFDIVCDQYKFWEKDPAFQKKPEVLYNVAKAKWEYEVVQFDESMISQINVKRSLFVLESQNRIDRQQYLQWVAKLPTNKQKIWFLRRIALQYRQIIDEYLLKVESYYEGQEELIISKYQAGLRLSDYAYEVELQYLYFLVRRINKHLSSDFSDPNYTREWERKVGFFRSQIERIIKHDNSKLKAEELKKHQYEFYKVWIEVEDKIIEDKEQITKISQILLKQFKQPSVYETYANSLLKFKAVKQAIDVLKRYNEQYKNQASEHLLKRKIALYGNTIIQQIEQHNQKQEKPKDLPFHLAALKDMMSAIEPLSNQLFPEFKSASECELFQVKEEQDKQESPKRLRIVYLDNQEQVSIEVQRKIIHMNHEHTVEVRGIPLDWEVDHIKDILRYPRHVSKIRLISKDNEQRDYCFIDFDSRQIAEKQVNENDSGYAFSLIDAEPNPQAKSQADSDESEDIEIGLNKCHISKNKNDMDDIFE